MTKEEATRFYNSGAPEIMTHQEIVKVGMFQDLLCIPFDKIHESIEEVLGRPVFTHEFADINRLRKEYFGTIPSPTLKEII